MTFSPVSVPMAALVLEGQNVFRATMSSPEWSVALDRPEAGAHQVPAGQYHQGNVVLKGGRPEEWFHTDLPTLEVDPAQDTLLRAGGPLNNTADATLNGGTLRLVYRLKGVGGRAYEPYYKGASSPLVSPAITTSSPDARPSTAITTCSLQEPTRWSCSAPHPDWSMTRSR